MLSLVEEIRVRMTNLEERVRNVETGAQVARARGTARWEGLAKWIVILGWPIIIAILLRRRR